jgi:membrane fusion protein, multidrug efflux system
MKLLLLSLFLTASVQGQIKQAAATKGNVHRWITLPGSLRANQQVTLLSKVPGYLQEILVDRGSVVKTGDILAKIAVPEHEADVRRLAAELKLAKTELQRLQTAKSKASDLITEQDIDKAAALVESTEAQLDKANTTVSYATIRAPFSGVITGRQVDVGAYISSQPLLALAETQTLRVQTNVPELEAALIKDKLPVKFAPEGQAKPLEAALSRNAGALDESSRTLLVEADFNNAEGKLRPGQYVSMKIAVDKHEGVVLIPSDALLTEKTVTSVFRLVDGKAKKAGVTIGFNDGTNVEIATGVTEGEQVLVFGKTALADGQAVTLAP